MLTKPISSMLQECQSGADRTWYRSTPARNNHGSDCCQNADPRFDRFTSYAGIYLCDLRLRSDTGPPFIWNGWTRFIPRRLMRCGAGSPRRPNAISWRLFSRSWLVATILLRYGRECIATGDEQPNEFGW